MKSEDILVFFFVPLATCLRFPQKIFTLNCCAAPIMWKWLIQCMKFVNWLTAAGWRERPALQTFPSQSPPLWLLCSPCQRCPCRTWRRESPQCVFRHGNIGSVECQPDKNSAGYFNPVFLNAIRRDPRSGHVFAPYQDHGGSKNVNCMADPKDLVLGTLYDTSCLNCCFFQKIHWVTR